MERSARLGKLVRTTDGSVVAQRLEVADSFWSRARGLLGRSSLDHGGGLLIEPCASVHMFFMKFPIDVVFAVRETEGDLFVRKVVADLGPWRMSACLGAAVAVELPAGTASAMALRPGDRLRFVPADAAKGI